MKLIITMQNAMNLGSLENCLQRLQIIFAAVSQARNLEKRLRDEPIFLQKYKETLTKDLASEYVEHAIGVLVDIEGMFTQIAIRKEDQSALCFLWLEDNVSRQYRYNRLIFGANCSPFFAKIILRKCAADHSIQFPEIHQAVRTNFYMDDFFWSFPNVSVARRLTENLRCVLMRGGFCPQNPYLITQSLSKPQLFIFQNPKSEKDTPGQTTSVLVQTKCLTDDKYIAPPPNPVPTPTTLRQLFSLVSSVFNPISLLAPFVIQFEILLQSLLKRGQKRDRAISNDLLSIVRRRTRRPISKLASYFRPESSLPAV